ncbi:MAG: thiolase family protein [Candidatus Marsarchaeota archaeon]|nr:thiolase family protein [Candidatus Marsarchaeota archaeon]
MDVYIADAARSPIGKFLGSLSSFTAPKLGAEVVKNMLSRINVKKDSVEELIAGNVLSSGLGQNPAKQVVVYAGLPNETPAYSVNMVCASGLKAVSLGSESISSGNANVVIAGGMESMTNSPFVISDSTNLRSIRKMGNISLAEFLDAAKKKDVDTAEFRLVDEMINEGLWDCYYNLHMGSLAEQIGTDLDISRKEQDEFALESHIKAAAATDEGRFDKEIIPITLPDGRIFRHDEGIRRDTNIEKLLSLKPAFEQNGTVTAGNSAQISDGASFLALMSGPAIDAHKLKPLAKIEAYAEVGSDPREYGLAPISAIKKVLDKAGMEIDEMDIIEINEAFCVQTLGVAKEMGIDTKKLNINGGATALGHPIGASGARILTTLVHALNYHNKKIGLAALCHGGGGAFAMIVKR